MKRPTRPPASIGPISLDNPIYADFSKPIPYPVCGICGHVSHRHHAAMAHLAHVHGIRQLSNRRFLD